MKSSLTRGKIFMKPTITNFIFILLISAGLFSPVYADIDPLSVYVRTDYPPTVKTIQDAAGYVLAPTGYRFISDYPAPLDADRIGSSRVPPVAKIHRTMQIIDALQLLVGQQYYIVIDRNNRLISFTQQP